MSPTSPPKQTSVSAAWAAWVADGSSSAGSQFLQRISSWIEGTSAQLLRARWPDTERPTSAQLEERLRHHLEVMAHAGDATYPEVLELARQGLIDEIAGGAVPPHPISRQTTRPRGRHMYS